MLTTMVTMSSASGGDTLWTTQQDFTVVASGNAGWNAGNAGEQTIATVATPDSDGSATNGSANFTAPGVAGTAGALSVQWVGAQANPNYGVFYGPDLVHLSGLLADMGTQGIIKFDFTYPQVHVGTYFDPEIVLNYDSNVPTPYSSFYYQQFDGSTTATPNANGFYTKTIAYTGFNNATTKDYFQIGVIYNSDWSPLDPYYVDNFRLIGHGDFNEDGHVNSADISAMEEALTNPTAYETTYGLSAANLATIGDFNADGNFTNADVQGFLNYLKAGSGSTSTVPEPASFVLLVLTVPVMLTMARRNRKKIFRY